MRDHFFKTAIAASILCTGCVAGPGGSNNAANRTIAGAAAGAVLGGLAGSALGSNAASGAIVGAIAGGAVGATVNPNHVFRRDTRGYCMLVDDQGQPVLDANGQPTYDETNRCEAPSGQ